MKTFIINLQSAEKRRRNALAEVDRAGLDYELVDAIDGSKLSEDEIAEKGDFEIIRQHPDWLTRGAIGCALSHIEVYKTIVDRGLEYALILEDDVELCKGFKNLLEGIKQELSQNEIVLLHYTSFAELELSSYQSTKLNSEYDLMTPMFLEGVASAACYVVTLGAARSLAENLTPVRIAADSFHVFYEREFVQRIRCVFPRPARVVGAKSTIEVTNQSSFRGSITRAIDNFEIPILHGILCRLRLKSVESRSKMSIVQRRSPLERTD